MRESIAAVALITRPHHEQRLWLAQWNRNWECYHLVGGHKRDDDSFRECVIREVAEEIGLRVEAEFFVADAPYSRLAYMSWSKAAQEDTMYTTELFDVELAVPE